MDSLQNGPVPLSVSMPQQESAVSVKHTSVAVVFLFTFLTNGIYLPVWFLTRRNQFNSLQSEEKLGKGVYLFAIVAFSAAVCLGLYSGLALFFLSEPSLGESGSYLAYADLAANLFTLIAIIPLVQQTFKAKRILLDHYNGHLRQNVTFSPVLTLLFLNLYLQYKINRLASP